MSRRNYHPLSYPLPPTHQGNGVGNPSASPADRQVFQDSRGRGVIEPIEYRPFEQRLAMGPFGLPSIPLEPHSSPARIIIFNNNMGGGRMRPMLQQFPRFLEQEGMRPPREINDQSKLTKEEQEIVLKKLKKQIYNPMPKTLARRVSLYYRDRSHDLNNKSIDKHGDEEDGKRCAICLEDFEAREEVMLTPCAHMFHEECIIPWVKNHGQCPVCRSALCERLRENATALNNNNNNIATLPPASNDLFAGELISLIQAVDEAFPWGA